MTTSDMMIDLTWELTTAVKSYLQTLQNKRIERFLLDWPESVGETRVLTSTSLPVLQYLERLKTAVSVETTPLVTHLLSVAHQLHWGQTYRAADFGEHFLTRYGWTELFGPRGVMKNDLMAAGFLFLGPDIEYPAHWHEPEEIYIPLTDGAYWQKGENGPWQQHRAGSVIEHPPWIKHAMRTESQPLLAIYLWRGNNLARKSTIR